MNTVLYYIHDPMCSWCWGFRPVWETVQSKLESQLKINYIVGGLAPDSDQPMSVEMQHEIARYWQTIQRKIPGTEFNYDFWQLNTPRRSTYPACRAVIAARQLNIDKEKSMILAIQKAYYLQAKNPSDNDALIDIATKIGLDKLAFTRLLNSDAINQTLFDEISFAKTIGAQGFPSLILEQQKRFKHIMIDYNQPDIIIDQITSQL